MPVISLASLKGGVGKTSVSVNYDKNRLYEMSKVNVNENDNELEIGDDENEIANRNENDDIAVKSMNEEARKKAIGNVS